MAAPRPVAPPAVERPSLTRDELLDQIFQSLIGEDATDVLKRLEVGMIKRALAHAGDNHARAAELLGMTRNTLKKRTDELGL